MMAGRKLARVEVATDDAPLCDRCLATIGDGAMDLDLGRLKLRGARLLIDKVTPVGSSEEHIVGDAGLIIAPAANERVRRTYGIEGRVLAVGTDIDPDDVAINDRVIIDEFAGRPIFWGNRRLPYWIVGIGEVMVAIERGE